MWEIDWDDLQVARLDIVLQNLWGHYESYSSTVELLTTFIMLGWTSKIGRVILAAPRALWTSIHSTNFRLRSSVGKYKPLLQTANGFFPSVVVTGL